MYHIYKRKGVKRSLEAYDIRPSGEGTALLWKGISKAAAAPVVEVTISQPFRLIKRSKAALAVKESTRHFFMYA
ncbi:hypothetical protein SAMN05421736_12089 [Evansella caseinilytica]|uniref:Uncharacterized protein n=1 Tax=Evansella caseinilytica TaxID=1503961 RepID=A0A1H3UE58_9BACI|nr:hypothetical protein SAMN05421736_12089 [Evansella caseinilytica]